MAFASSIQKSQIPIGCQLCETGSQIKFKCVTCKLLMCDPCTGNHAKTSKNHQVINIKNIGQTITFSVNKQHEVDMKNIHFMTVSPDGSLFIADLTSEKLQNIILNTDNVTVLSRFDKKVGGLTISPTGSLLISSRFSLELYNPKTGQIVQSKYSVHPLYSLCVHVTNDRNVLVSAFDGNGNSTLIIMDEDGKHLKQYNKHKDGQLFKWIHAIATTSNGNIFVAERSEHQVVVIKHEGDFTLYRGHPDINSSERLFDPLSLLRALNDNIIVIDFKTFYFHLLNINGEIITYYNPGGIGIIAPRSLALSPSGGIYVGCLNPKSAPPDTKAKLYELDFTGI